MSKITSAEYKKVAGDSIADPVLQSALESLQSRLGPATQTLYQNLPEGQELRKVAHGYRRKAIDNLDILLETLADNVQKHGGQVHFAATDKEAVEICLSIARKHAVKKVVKGKSMVTEEIGLNDALEDAGIDVAETDLGEFIIQLAGEKPTHIVAPAIHKTRQQVGELFSEKLGTPYSEDPPTLTFDARKALRQNFLDADMGISGCNLACAETGHITTVSNEGNIRMSTTLPKVHVAFMGMERIVANLEEQQSILRLMSMGAAGQQIGGYVSYIGGPAATDHCDGPEAFHLVIVDNGRSKILADEEFREMLCCIRCGACLNVCPVYGKIGGHAYGSAYTGPVGAVVTPLLFGVNNAADLCTGETLCGACRQACPLEINLPRMLLALRAKLSEGDSKWEVEPKGKLEKLMFEGWQKIIQRRKVYDGFLKIASVLQKLLPGQDGMIRRLPFPFNGWTNNRNLKPLAAKTFMQRWKEREGGTVVMQGRTEFIQNIGNALGRGAGNPADTDIFTTSATSDQEAVFARIKARTPAERKQLRSVIEQVAGPLHIDFHPEDDLDDIAGAISRLIREKDPEWGTEKSVVRWDHPLLNQLHLESLAELDVVSLYTTASEKSAQSTKDSSLIHKAKVRKEVEASFIGITSADYLVAATATLAMRSRPGHARSVSLVPSIHVVVIEEEKLLATLEELYTLLKWDPKELAQGLTNCLSLISGPSKTGDIELVMVHGAHGPRELHLFVVKGEAP